MQIKLVILEASKILDKFPNPFLEARLLMQHITKLSLEELIKNYDKEVPDEQLLNFNKLLDLRKNYYPMAYILGYKEFYGLEFIVDENVLIPRPDSEILIEAILKDYKIEQPSPRVLDLGSGSGCLIISLLYNLPNSYGVALDICPKALEICKKNAIKHNVNQRLELFESDWFSGFKEDKFDIIIANPPYISLLETDLVAKETLQYEPKKALFAARNGLRDYIKIAKNAKNYLSPYGRIYLEIGFDQALSVKKIFDDEGYVFVEVLKDFSGHNRGLVYQQAE